MKPRSLAACVVAWIAAAGVAQDAPPVRLTVGLVAAQDGRDTGPLLERLRGAGMQVRHVLPAACAPEALRTVDVVVVHWPAAQAIEGAPLGAMARWDRPTVFLGSSGPRFAAHWGLPDAAAIAAMPAAARGPEMHERARPAAATIDVWQQGNLVHFGRDDAAAWAAADAAWFVATVRAAARFAADRPIWRLAAAADAPRRERVAAACTQLAIAAGDRTALFALPDRFDGADRRCAAQLLVDLLPDGKDEDATKSTWQSWLKVHGDALVFDPLSTTWRLDWLAFWRGTPSAELRGDARADGALREPAAVALATKVVQRHGGDALADLGTFTCWLRNMHFTWDRRSGVFRAENHSEPQPGGRGSQWHVSVFDTVADEQLIWGGGPAPRPRVGARTTFRELVEQVFLPALLLEPGTSLRRVPEHDGDGTQAIAVRLGGRCADLAAEHVLLVAPATGDLVEVRRIVRDRVQHTFRVAGTAACGPLVLPVRFVETRGGRSREFAYEDVVWNPPVPATLATATERLTKPRER